MCSASRTGRLALDRKTQSQFSPTLLHIAQFVATPIYLQFCKYNRSLELDLTEASKFGDVAGTKSFVEICTIVTSNYGFNPLKPELNPICYLLALLGVHHFLHVSRIRVKSICKCVSILGCLQYSVL